MAYNTLQEYLAAVDAAIYENVTGDITATALNELLKGAGNRTWEIAMRGYDVVVTTTPTIITFVGTFADTNYSILTRGFDAQGEPIDLKITNKTTTGFTVTGAVDGFVDYYAEN